MKVRSANVRVLSVFGIVLMVLVMMLLVSIDVNAYADTPVLVEKSPEFKNLCLNEGSVYGVSFENSIFHFLPNESITATYSVDPSRSITNLNYISEGLTVISATVDPNAANCFSVVIACTTDADTHKLTIEATINDGETETAYLYVFANEYGTFISPFSNFDAKHKFYVYARENGFMTQTDYEHIQIEIGRELVPNNLVIQDRVNTNIGDVSINSTSPANSSASVEGVILWVDDEGNSHPARNIKIEIYESAPNNYSFLEFVGTTSTNNIGEYSYVFNDNNIFADFANGNKYIYVKLYAGDDNAKVLISDSEDPYECLVVLSPNQISGTTINWGYTFPMDHTSEYIAEFSKALQISQAILTARDYAKSIMGETPENVTVWYPFYHICSYDRNLKAISITGNPRITSTVPHAYASWDAIMHEYGHHIQYQMNINGRPTGITEHTGDINHADEYSNKDIGTRLAWAESWPTVFAILAQHCYSEHLTNIDTVSDLRYDAYNLIGYSIESEQIALGDACERSMIAALWDFADGYNGVSDTHDKIDLTDLQFFNVTTGNESKTFSDFIVYFYEQHPDMVHQIGAILSHYNMASSRPTVTNTVSDTVSPDISWDAQGGSNEFPNNNFTVIIYGSDNQEILRINVGGVTSYTLTDAEWRQVLYTHGTTFRVAISATQTASPLTGPYISELSVNYTKPDLTITSWMISGNSRYAEKIVELQPGDYADYSVKFLSGGYKIIQTFGAIDAKISIFDHTGSLITSDDDHGYGTNALISYNFLTYESSDPQLENNVYTIRVQFYSKAATGKIKLAITPAQNDRSNSATGISTYENIRLLNVTNTYEHESSFERGYVNVVTVIPSATGSYTFELVSDMNTYIYIIDPRSNALVKLNENCADNHKNENGTDLDPLITVDLEAGIRYYIVFAPYSPKLIAENETVEVALIIRKE